MNFAATTGLPVPVHEHDQGIRKAIKLGVQSQFGGSQDYA